MELQTVDERGQSPTAADGVESALVGIAREFFARCGYADASLNAIVEAAGVTKGAVYYYFSGKRDLFRAVYVAEYNRLTDTVAAAFGGGPDAWDAVQNGIRALACGLLDDSVRRIVLIDAPFALGLPEARAAASPNGVELIREGLQRAADGGLLAGHRIDLLAPLVYGAVCEAAHQVGEAPDPAAMLEPVLAQLRLSLDRLAAGPAAPAR